MSAQVWQKLLLGPWASHLNSLQLKSFFSFTYRKVLTIHHVYGGTFDFVRIQWGNVRNQQKKYAYERCYKSYTHTLSKYKAESINIGKRDSIECSGASRDGKVDFKLMRKETQRGGICTCPLV